jgi:2-polyprenyl-3-methyl-5-hydroxy-6-metoxy-1,4-benzoquinol methylase
MDRHSAAAPRDVFIRACAWATETRPDEHIAQSRNANLDGDSPFAPWPSGSLAWIGPLRDDTAVLDVACGAAHATDPVAPHVRQVVAVDLTRELLVVSEMTMSGS